jgi:heat induced stress protein YflT
MAATQTKTNTQTNGSREAAAAAAPRQTLASYPTYAGAERAVDWLSDQGFAVEHLAIVGKGLRSVEQVTSRMTGGRAALIGAGQGSLIGVLFALLFGVFFNGPAFAGLLLYGIVVGGLFGALFGGMAYGIDSDGERDFVSESSIVADHYEVQADDEVADEAKRVLVAMPGA